MVESLRETEEDVLTRFGLSQIEFSAALHHLLAVFDEMLQHARERKHFRHAVDERKHVVVERALKVGVFIQSVEHRLRMRSALQFDHDAVIEADVPLSQMFGYVTTLRSLSQGRATASMEPSHYAPVSGVEMKVLVG